MVWYLGMVIIYIWVWRFLFGYGILIGYGLFTWLPFSCSIHSRHTCEVRVTVLGLSVCVCVSPAILALQATKWPTSDTSGLGLMRA